MSFILKYSGEDRDYFLVSKTQLKVYEYLVHEFSNANENIEQIFKSYVKHGYVYNDANMSHLRTINRDIFRMFILKEYGVDMITIEKQMNEKYMETYISSDDESSDENYNEKMTIYEMETSSEEENYSEEENINEEDLI